jgi:hypothetical protein
LRRQPFIKNDEQSYILNTNNKGGESINNKIKLKIRFHNPNTSEDTIKYISNIFADASKIKFENLLNEVVQNNYMDEKEAHKYT